MSYLTIATPYLLSFLVDYFFFFAFFDKQLIIVVYVCEHTHLLLIVSEFQIHLRCIKKGKS